MRSGQFDWRIHDDGGRRKYLNAAERERFLAQLALLPPDRRALCQLLVHSGCRVSEALGVARHHVDAERGTVTFRTLKRRRTAYREVPIPKSLLAEILALPSDASGRFWRCHRVTAWRYVHALAERSRIEQPRACPRGLRHGFGIHAAASNIPLNLIQRWMGHASPDTTAIYLDAVGDEERSFAERMW